MITKVSEITTKEIADFIVAACPQPRRPGSPLTFGLREQ